MVRLVGTEVRSRSCRGEEPGPGTTSGEGLRGSQRRNLGCQLPHLADLLGSAPRTTEALWGLLRHPFPGTAKREHEGVSRGQVLPVVASLRAPPARPRLGTGSIVGACGLSCTRACGIFVPRPGIEPTFPCIAR